jgi:hypothetical protein
VSRRGGDELVGEPGGDEEWRGWMIGCRWRGLVK